jgi:radical SAM superfamily enzyme YgiQ (UPF0313 family)
MNITLVNPPRLKGLTRRPSRTAEPHLGLAYVAAALRADGVNVRLLDAEAEGLDAETAARKALDGDPLFIGFTAPTALIKSAATVAEQVKRLNPEVVTVIGGYHATVLPEATLEEFAQFDVAVYGEGEQTAVELARALERKDSLRNVAGIVCRENGRVVKTPERQRAPDLDRLAKPAWELFDLDRYHAHYRSDNSVRELPVNTGRGCPGRCTMCARVSGGRVRRRSPENILEEIVRDVEQFNAGAIVFMDETFAADRDATERLCRGMIERGLEKRIYWLCQTRVDSVDAELLSLMGRAGCRHISYGVEAADPEVLAGIGKPMDPARVHEAVKNAQAAGILVDNFFILGLPGENPSTIKKTIDLAVSLDSDFANFFILVPYPGTKVYEMAKQGQGGLHLLSKDWDMYGIQMGRALELDGLSRSKMENLQFRAYLRFYLRPKRIMNMLRMVDPKVLPIYLWNLFTGSLRGFFGKEKAVAG